MLVPGQNNNRYAPTGNTYVKSWEKKKDILLVKTVEGELSLKPYEMGALHYKLTSSKKESDTKSYAVVKDFSAIDFNVEEDTDNLKLTTANYKFVLHKYTGNYSFYDSNGKLLLREITNKRKFVRQDSISPSPHSLFKLTPEEALYGLGQFRDNALNLRGKKRELVQFNTQAAVPVIYSTANWGLLWDNPSRTVYSDSEEGMCFTSDYGDEINYYLFTGKTFDELVSVYRRLTGRAPMIPRWALGYHQSRNKYGTQAEVLNIANRMAAEKIPFSSIFIDYYYWGKYGTGSHRFDESLFPNPEKMLDTLHNLYKTQAVITVWPTFKPGTEHYKELETNGFLLKGVKALDGIVYDVFNPQARELYWKQLQPLIETGFGGWFLDGPEPDHVASFLAATTFAGPAPAVRNLYPLLHSENFYNHYRQFYPDKRPYLLTRCAWASQQRAGTAVWSGDIPATFDELEKQITAGLNFTATGIPYWTTDIGGYSGGNPANESYRELFARWFEYGVFCPIFRSHGRRYPGDTHAPNELWAYGTDIQRICTKYIQLRYALMPYIYALSGLTTHHGYTPMRLLAFDFPEDPAVFDCKDEFMYGPSLLVCPVRNAGRTDRKVYLPKGTSWINFWTGQIHQGGQTITAEAPLDIIPVYVKTGAIIPVYSESEPNYSSESAIKLYVFAGEDGNLELYDDDGISFDYEKGNYSLIPVHWNNRNKELLIEEQRGNYRTGQTKELQIVIVENSYNNLFALPVMQKVLYNCKKTIVKF
jgi:alpha-D-xyloside xylohydrolase